MKAKQLKEQEELKEQKRKELKAAKLAAAQSAASGSGKEPRSPWGKVAKGISKVAENVNKMGGMVGFVKKSSTTAEAPVTKPFSSNITANANTSSNNITKQPFDVRATESKSSLSAAPCIVAAPAPVSAPIQVVATVDTLTNPVVIAAEEISLSKPIIPVTAEITPTPTPTSPAALPPKSAIKDIIAKYNEAVNSPIVAKPLPVLPTAATTALVNISPVAAPTAPPVMTVAPVIAPSVPSVSAAIAEPQVLRERVIPTAQVAPVVPIVIPPALPLQEVKEVEEEVDYDPANNYQIEDT